MVLKEVIIVIIGNALMLKSASASETSVNFY
jgi:hypothetical protein